MCLYVTKPDALGTCDGGQSGHLLHHQLSDFFGLEAHFAASETLCIAEAWMGTDRYAFLRRKANDMTHDDGIARMKSTRDVPGGDGTKETLIASGVVNTREFTDVGVQVHAHGD